MFFRFFMLLTVSLVGGSFFVQLHAQQRKLRVANEAIDDANFEKALDKISQYEKKEGITVSTLFLKTKVLTRTQQDVAGADSAANIFASFASLYAQLIPKDIQELCDDLNICDTTIRAESVRLEALLYEVYRNTADVASMNRFLTYYSGHSRVADMREVRDSIAFVEVMNDGSRGALTLFMDTYKNSRYAPIAEKKLFSWVYDEARKKNDPSIIRDYIVKYPQSMHAHEALSTLADEAWMQLLNRQDTAILHEFIRTYAGTMRAEEARTILADNLLQQIYKTSRLALMDQFLSVFPDHPKSKLVREWRQTLRYPIVPYLVSRNEYRMYNTFNNSFVGSITFQQIIPAGMNQFIVKSRCSYGVMDGFGREVLPVNYSAITFQHGHYLVCTANGWGLYNRDGRTVISPSFNQIQFLNDSILKVNRRESDADPDQWQLWSIQGTPLWSDQFQEIHDLQNGTYVIRQSEHMMPVVDTAGGILSNGFSQLVDSAGGILSNRYDRIFPNLLSKQYLAVEHASRNGLIDLKGRIIIPIRYKSVNEQDDRYFSISSQTDLYGIYDIRSGLEMLPMKHSSIQYLGKDLFSVGFKKNSTGYDYYYKLYHAGLKQYVNNDVYSSLQSTTKGRIIFSKNGKFGLLTMLGYPVPGFLVDELEDFPISKTLFRFKRGDRYGLVDTDGKIRLPAQYDYIESYFEEGEGDCGCGDGIDSDLYLCDNEDDSGNNNTDNCKNGYGYVSRALDYSAYQDNYLIKDGLAAVSKNGRYGYVDSTGKLVIPCTYKTAGYFQHGYATVGTEKYSNNTQSDYEYDYKIIDRAGNVILDEYRISQFTQDPHLAIVEKDSQYAVFDFTQNKLITLSSAWTDHTYLTYEGDDLFSFEYKENQVYTTIQNGMVYANNKIDYSQYDYNQKINALNAALYNEEKSASDIIRELQQLESTHPNDCKLIYLTAKAYVAENNAYYARRYFQRTIEMVEDKEVVYLEWASFEYEKENWSDFIDVAQEILSMQRSTSDNYTYKDILFKKAYALQQLSRSAEAFNDYTELLRVDSKNYAAYCNRGFIYMNYYRNFSYAYNDFSTAIRHCPTTDAERLGLFHFGRGSALYNLARYSEACTEWRKAVSYGNQDAVGHLRYCR
jgi:hypothetical protein